MSRTPTQLPGNLEASFNQDNFAGTIMTARLRPPS